jgi:hypothetical protein
LDGLAAVYAPDPQFAARMSDVRHSLSVVGILDIIGGIPGQVRLPDPGPRVETLQLTERGRANRMESSLVCDEEWMAKGLLQFDGGQARRMQANLLARAGR